MQRFAIAFARAGDWYRSLSGGARAAVALALVVATAGLIYLGVQQMPAGDTALFGDEPIPSSQQSAMLEAFAAAGLTDYRLVDNRIHVPQDRQAVYMGALATAGALPNNFGDSLRKMLDKTSSPWITRSQQEEMSRIALQDELSKILNSMPGIEHAVVLYHMQTEDNFAQKKQITASVDVKPIGDELLAHRQIEMIRHVVGPPIGISPDSVTVIDFNGATYPGGTGNSLSEASDAYSRAQLDYEQRYTQVVRDAVSSYVSGATVTVNVELKQAIAQGAPDRPIAPSAGPDDTPQNEGRLPRSQPAGSSNQPGAIAAFVEAVMGQNSLKPPDPQRTKTPAGNVAATNRPKWTLQHIAVNVSVPASAYEKIWLQRQSASNCDPQLKPELDAVNTIEKEVCSNLKDHIERILSASDTSLEDPLRSVTVTTLPHPITAQPARLGRNDRVHEWSDRGVIIAGVAAAAIMSVIVMNWTMITRRRRAEREKLQLIGAHEVIEAEHLASQVEHNRRKPRDDRRGPSLRDELAEVVRDDPDVAVNVLRNWIASAG